MSQIRYSEASFETVVEAHLLTNGYVTVSRDGFDRAQSFQRLCWPSFERPRRRSGLAGTPPTQQQSALSPCFKERRTALIAAAMTGRNTIHESREDNLQGGRHERRQRATVAGGRGTVSR